MQLNDELWDKAIKGLPVLAHVLVLSSLKSDMGLISLKMCPEVEEKWLSFLLHYI